ncbi:TPA: aldo/keto reductase [Salmonella enterica]
MDNEKGHNRPGHDGLFKLFLREPDTARDFLAVHLPADIRAQVRLDTLKLEAGSFVDQKLRELHSDVLYSVETAEGHAGYIYCLVEHQSTADRMMAWRMMRYSMAVMDAHLKKGNGTLPVVVPLLFYQGTVRPYPYSTDWMDCFDVPALAREVYSRPWPLVDVSVMEDCDLQSHRRMALLELVQRDIPVEDVADCMGKLIREGKIRGWGQSQSDTEQISRAHAVTPLSAIQSEYSLMERMFEKDVLPLCHQLNIGFVAFSPMASGFLAGGTQSQQSYTGDDVRRVITRFSDENVRENKPLLDILNELATEKGCSTAQLSLAWMLKKWSFLTPIPGGRKFSRIDENLNADDVTLSEEEMHTLEIKLSHLNIKGNRTDEDISKLKTMS